MEVRINYAVLLHLTLDPGLKAHFTYFQCVDQEQRPQKRRRELQPPPLPNIAIFGQANNSPSESLPTLTKGSSNRHDIRVFDDHSYSRIRIPLLIFVGYLTCTEFVVVRRIPTNTSKYCRDCGISEHQCNVTYGMLSTDKNFRSPSKVEACAVAQLVNTGIDFRETAKSYGTSCVLVIRPWWPKHSKVFANYS